ncbi:hypothetical protein ACTOJ1_000469 [Shigella flexneri]
MTTAIMKEVLDLDVFQQIHLIQVLTQNVKSKKKALYEQKFGPQFIFYMNTLPSQKFGTLIEKKVGEFFKWKQNKSSLGRGDFNIPDGHDVEFKTSLISDKSQKLNLVQIRLWEKTDFLCVAFRMIGKKVHLFPFYLTHEQMEKEVGLLGTAAHGGKKIANSNLNTESSIRIKITKNDDTFVRWFNMYRTDLFDKKAKGFVIPKTLEEVIF